MGESSDEKKAKVSEQRVSEVNTQVAATLESLQSLFVPEARMTLVVRVPGSPGSELILTNDVMSSVAQVLILNADAPRSRPEEPTSH